MKRKLLSLILAALLCLSLAFTAAAAENDLLWDDAGLLTQAEHTALEQQLTQISQKHQAEIRIITTEKTVGDPSNYIRHLYDSNHFGYGEYRDGVLLLVCMDLRVIRIISNGLTGDAISRSDIDQITEAISDDMSDGDYASALSLFVEQCDYYITGHTAGFPFDFQQSLIIALIIGIIIGVVVVMILRGQLKTVRKQNQANNYVRKNSMQVTQSSDLYLYRHVRRTRKETSKSSSGGRSGGSRNVGGGSF